ncbi:nucleotidyltransferase family protein [Candidatus Margulisiibacteriota bacterium]
MTKTNNQSLINSISDYFSSKPVSRAYLFGSTARNENTEDSDIDILVELDHSKPIGFGFFKMHLELEGLLGKKVDLATPNSLSVFIKSRVNKEKKLIYEKKTR